MFRQGFGDHLTDADRIEKVKLFSIQPDPLAAVGLSEPMPGGFVKAGAHSSNSVGTRN
jgi:hypothetical protein